MIFYHLKNLELKLIVKIIEIQGYVVLINHNAIHLDQLKLHCVRYTPISPIMAGYTYFSFQET